MKLRGLERALLFIVGGAFVLSLFIGLVSKKPLGIALGRAFLSSVLFGAIIAGGALLLRRFIPDLGSMVDLNRKGEEPEAGDAETGRVVDYTVGEGITEGMPGGLHEAEAYAGAGSPFPEQGDVGADIGEFGRFSQVTGPGESGELSLAGGRAQESGRAPLASARRAKPGEGSGAGTEVRGAGPEEGDAIDEALPSLDTLFESEEEESGPAETGAPEERHEERKRTGGKGDYINIRDARIPNEPGVMAKAIRRVMKQD
jgi:hypothetical protein